MLTTTRFTPSTARPVVSVPTQKLPSRCILAPLCVARPALEVPPLHGSFATESWAEEVCEIKPEPGSGKQVALKCAQALDELSEVQHRLAMEKKACDAAEAARIQQPGRCVSPSDDECDTI